MRPAFPAGSPGAVHPLSRQSLAPAMPRFDEREPCGGETVLDLALCLILAFAVVGLLLLAL